MSKPRKPTALKVISGTDRKDRDVPNAVTLPLVSDIPEAPSWMPNAHAVKEWDRLASILYHNNLLTDASLTTLGILCSLFGKICQLYSAGESPTGHMIAQYRGLANDFGLTPVAQGKVRAGEKDKTGNKFANNGRK
jgi:phage terminase small subunit